MILIGRRFLRLKPMGRQPEAGTDRGSLLNKILPKSFSKSSRTPSEISIGDEKNNFLSTHQLYDFTRATSEVVIKIDAEESLPDVTKAFEKTSINSSFSNNALFTSARSITRSNSLRNNMLVEVINNILGGSKSPLNEVQYNWKSPVISMNDIVQNQSNSSSSVYTSSSSFKNSSVDASMGRSSSSTRLFPLPSIRKSSTESSTTFLNVNAVAPKLPKRAKPIPRKGPVLKPFQKFNSCNTLFSVDSSLYRPSASVYHLDVTLKVCSYAIMSLMEMTKRLLLAEEQALNQTRQSSGLFRSRSALNERPRPLLKTYDVLSQRRYPFWGGQTISEDALEHPASVPLPSFEDVYGFFRNVFLSMELSAEVAVISLIYIERFLEETQVMLHPINVFRVLLGGVALASKVWDDQAVWNEDFCSIFPHVKKKDINSLEQWWLSKIKWRVNVKRHLFTQYWFEMRHVAERVYETRVGDIELQNVLKSSGQLSTFKLPQEINKHNYFRSSSRNSSCSMESDDPDLYLKEPDTFIVERRRKSVPLTLPPKPLNELHMSALSISTSFSQCQLRQSISMSLAVRKRDEASNANISKNQSQALSKIKDEQETTRTSFNLDVVDIGWGGKNLRRAQSDFIYQPIIPAASVL